MSKWIEVTVDNNLLALVKTGNPPQNILQNAEQELKMQYADASGDNHYRLYINLMKEIARLEITLAQIQSLAQTLREAYHPAFAKELNSLLHTSFVFDVTKPEHYDKNIDRCINRAKGIKITVDLKTIAFKKLEERYKSGGGKVTREYYMGHLIVLSDDSGFPLNENITVWEFCERVRRYNKKYEPKLKPTNNGK